MNAEIDLVSQSPCVSPLCTYPLADLPIKERTRKNAVAGYHYAPTVLFAPNCTLSPCGEEIHEQKTLKDCTLLCVVCKNSCLCKNMIADPFLL